MSKQILLAERSHVLADLANVERCMRATAFMRDSARCRAELVLAHCADEVRDLTDQLLLLDAGLARLQSEQT